MWLPDSYGASFAHSVRVDKYDNVWIVDEGSGMVVKLDPNGVVKMTLGRKTEAIDYLERFLERGEKCRRRIAIRSAAMGTFNRPTDVTWDAQDNIYISDGYGNSRFVKIAKDGVWQKAVGTHGTGPNQFNTPHGIAVRRPEHLRRRPRQLPHPGVRHEHELQGELREHRRALERAGHAEVHLQRRRHGQDLPARSRHGKAARLGANQHGPGPDRLPHSRAPRGVRHRAHQRRLLGVERGEDHLQELARTYFFTSICPTSAP